jgi:predicted metal-dependent peptidase
MDKALSLSKIAKELMLIEPYYGFFLIMLNKTWRKDLPTAGVSKNGINYQLAINEEFWTSLSEEHQLGLLKHELLHIAFGHLTSFGSFSDKKLANVALDMEINQYIDWAKQYGEPDKIYVMLIDGRKFGILKQKQTDNIWVVNHVEFQEKLIGN